MRDLVSSPMPALALRLLSLFAGKDVEILNNSEETSFVCLFKAAVTAVLKKFDGFSEAWARPCDTDSVPASIALREKHTCIPRLLVF